MDPRWINESRYHTYQRPPIIQYVSLNFIFPLHQFHCSLISRLNFLLSSNNIWLHCPHYQCPPSFSSFLSSSSPLAPVSMPSMTPLLPPLATASIQKNVVSSEKRSPIPSFRWNRKSDSSCWSLLNSKLPNPKSARHRWHPVAGHSGGTLHVSARRGKYRREDVPPTIECVINMI